MQILGTNESGAHQDTDTAFDHYLQQIDTDSIESMSHLLNIIGTTQKALSLHIDMTKKR